LSDADRSAIRERVANGEKKRAIALQLGLHPSTIGRVIYRPLRSRSATRSA
jgi:IS30 family transposase